MPCLAAIHWSYIALVVVVITLLVASPFLLVLFRSARAIAHTSTDDFRLSNPHMWTDPRHTADGGALQLMRLPDGHFVLVSVGVSTVKVFTTPDRADAAQYCELREFPVDCALERLDQTSEQRRPEDLLCLDRVRRAIGWPQSLSNLVSSVDSIDDSLLLHGTRNA